MTTTPTSTSPTGSNVNDPRPLAAIAIRTALDVVANVQADQHDLPTPCTDYPVRDLLGHLRAVFERLTAIGAGTDPMAVQTEPPFAPVPDWPAAFAAAAGEANEAWRDPASLDRIVVLPWATAPGRAMLARYVNELTVHTWDLAKATGQQPAWDPAVLELAWAAIRQGLPETPRDWAPFDAVVPTPAGAPFIDRLVAWNGRRP